MRVMRWIRGAVALTLLIVLVGCAPQTAPQREDVPGTIERSDGSAIGICHLTVTTVTGDPVGETAQIVPPGDQFNWPLPPGEYVLNATCATATGELDVHVPSEESRDLVILVS
jgi:hypothetical protein